MDVLLQQILNGLILGSLYALVALGYTMVYGILELINFAHGEIVMLGAMVSVTVLSVLAALGVPVPLALLAALAAAMAVCVATGVLDERGRPPRLHDLRHSFAVTVLERCYQTGTEFHSKLPHLATYLGHVNPGCTHHYLHLTPQLQQAANRRFQDYALRMFAGGGAR